MEKNFLVKRLVISIVIFSMLVMAFSPMVNSEKVGSLSLEDDEYLKEGVYWTPVDFTPAVDSGNDFLDEILSLEKDVVLEEKIITPSPSFCSAGGYQEFTNPWTGSFAWTDPEDTGDCYMNADTGVGRAYPQQMPFAATRACCGIVHEYLQFNGEYSHGAIVFKDPSWVDMEVYPAGICTISMTLDEYDPSTGEKTNHWYDTVLESQDYRDSLNDIGMYVTFRKNYVYSFSASAYCYRGEGAAGSVDEVRFKKVRWLWWNEYTLDVDVSGKGSVTLDPDKDSYVEGTQVTLTAKPKTGWNFDHWEGDLSGTSSTKTLTMNSNKHVKAVFKEDKDYELHLIEPDAGCLYFVGRKFNFLSTFSFAIIIGSVEAVADDDGTGISSVEFVVGSNSFWDRSSSSGTFSAEIDASRGIYYIEAIGYDGSSKEVARSSTVRALFF